MSGAGFLRGTMSPAAMQSNQPAAAGPSVCASSACTLPGCVVVAMASVTPAARASCSSLWTPGRSDTAPVLTSAS